MKLSILSLLFFLSYLNYSYQIRILYDTDLPGGDYNNFTTEGLVSCTNACKNDDRCQAFTFNPRTNLCWLKDKINQPSNSPGAISGTK